MPRDPPGGGTGGLCRWLEKESDQGWVGARNPSRNACSYFTEFVFKINPNKALNRAYFRKKSCTSVTPRWCVVGFCQTHADAFFPVTSTRCSDGTPDSTPPSPPLTTRVVRLPIFF